VSTLVTGGCGFVGSHLVERLASQGKPVTIVDDLSGGSGRAISDALATQNVEFVEADLTDRERTRAVVSGHDRVYHLAARIGGVGYLRERPADIISENDLLNASVFGAAAREGVERLVYASSSMVYAEAATFPCDEDQVERISPPSGSYGFQKLNGEYYCDAYQRQYDFEYAVVRIANAVGPRDWPAVEVGHGHVVPDVTRKVVTLEQDPVKVKGSGRQTRCFTDVRDVVTGLVRCMTEPAAANEAFNVSTMDETTIRELVELVWTLAGRDDEPRIRPTKSFEKDVKRRVLSNEKARRVLGWQPEYGLREAVENYLDAYREWEAAHGAP
jgi:nucleoside-diphosphate-sugar epimerase